MRPDNRLEMEQIENMEQKQPSKKTSIGGQALIEGGMMRGVGITCLAVRQTDGTIYTEQWGDGEDPRPWYKRTPIIRGGFNFIEMMVLGYKCLMKSAELAGFEDEEPSAFEKKLASLLGDKFSTVMTYLVVALGVALAMGLFVVLPAFVAGLLAKVIHSQLILTVVEGVTKIGLLIAYLGLVAQMDEIHRMYQYHGAEHKTIACYEAGEELTPANVKKHTRFHPRCGTSFLLIVLVISILVFSILPRGGSLWITVGLKLLLMPLVVGIAYEIIKLAGRYDNWLTRLISKPGLWLQRLTTKEPDESMMEVAIAAMKPCIPKEEGLDNW